MINLPQKTRNRAYFSIAKMAPGTAWDAQSWSTLPVPEILTRDISGNTRIGDTVAQGGYTVESITRACLPDEDMASFSVDFGWINGVEVTPQDLSGHWIRIDVIDDENFPSSDDTDLPSTGYKTVFVGFVYNAKSRINPSSLGKKAMGKRTYYCQGVLSRCRYWPMSYHAAFGGISGTTLQKCFGNPGYNYPINGLFRETIGNKSSSTDSVEWGTDPTNGWVGHALPIDATGTAKWTDVETIKHALSSSRQDGEPIFTVDFSGAAGLFDGTFAWAVNEGDSCFDHLRRVCSRSRGRGSVYADWTSDGSRTGTIDLFLRAVPSFSGNVTYNTKADFSALDLTTANVIQGQTSSAGSEIDLVGDHRFYGSFEYEDRASAVFDYIELIGERIQLVANLGVFGGSYAALQKGWTATDETEFSATTNYQQRIIPRFRHVYRRFTLKQGWNFTGYVDTLTPGTSYGLEAFNIICGENGEVRTAPWLPDDLGNSPVTSRIMADVPLYEGKDYDGTAKAGYWSAASEYMPAPRMQPQLLYQSIQESGDAGTVKRWIPLERFGFNLQVDDFGVLITHQAEDSTGVRMLGKGSTYGSTPGDISNKVDDKTGLDPDRLLLVMGLELSNHVGMRGLVGPLNAVSGANERGRRLVIPVNGLHFWCGTENAVWQCDPTNLSNLKFSEALRFSDTKPVRIIRDDRDAMSFMFALAKKYYGEVHNPGTWSLRDFGLRSSYATQTGSSTFPTLGQLVSTVAVSPTEKITLNTPITSIHYDNNECITTWRTDYVNYQPGIQ